MIERFESEGLVQYFLNNELHRPNGPARMLVGDAVWYLYGKRHRYYGPYSGWLELWFIHGGVIK